MKYFFLAIKFKITAIIDERYQRTKETILEMKSSNLSICLSSKVNILVTFNIFYIILLYFIISC